MSDLVLFFNCAVIAYFLREQLSLWVSPDRARVEIQDALDKRHGRDPDHAKIAADLIPVMRFGYGMSTIVWTAILISLL